jgi:hypothetical protein
MMNWKMVVNASVIFAIFTWFTFSVPASVKLGQLNTEAPKDNPDWVRYTDSAEGAFSMDVPVGWQVQGGMYRFGYFDVRWMMDVRSLDSKIILRIFDVNVPPYTLPGPHTGRDGQPYSRPQQFQMMVSNYQQGQLYAELYAKNRFSSLCKTLRLRQQNWVPTMPAAPQWVQYQNQLTQIGLDQISAGFQQFRRQMQAYHKARTDVMNQQVAKFESRQSLQGQQVSLWGETLTGLQNVSDPLTGTHFQVFTGPKPNYYVNGNGVKINSDVSPGPDFHQLTTSQER